MVTKKVLVTGATGMIGNLLVQRLLRDGNEVTVLSRDARSAEKKLALPCRYFSWSMPEKDLPPADALQDLDAVIHLAGESVASGRWTVARKKSIHDSRVLSTRNLIQGLKGAPKKPESFISASAIGFYGSRGDEALSEDSNEGREFLAEVCRDWEKEVAAARGLAMRTVSVRIGIVLSKTGGAMDKLLPVFRAGIGGPVGSGSQWMSWIHVDDLVSIFEKAIFEKKMQGAVNGVAPVPVTNREFSKTLGRVLNRPAFMPAPAIALRLAMGELASLVLDSQRVEPRVLTQLGFEFKFPELSAALRDVAKR